MAGEQHGFVELVREIDYVMFVVTAAADGERAGCLVGFTTQTSIHPPRFLVCLSRKNHTYRVACRLGRPRACTSWRPGRRSSRSCSVARPATRSTSSPAAGGGRGLAACRSSMTFPDWFAGRVLDRVDLGDHVGFLLAPIDGQAGRGPRPLTFHRARRIEAGHPA